MKLKHLFLAVAMAASLTASAACAPAQAKKAPAQQSPRYAFLMIGAGMGPGPVMAAQNYLHYCVDPDSVLNMLQLPVSSRQMSYSASSPVTDSAAAGTALSTGTKTKNAMLGMNPDTVAVISVARRLKDQGWGIGLVTNNAPDDATPGAFYAHVPNRSMYYEVDRDAAFSGYDFISGAQLRGAKDKAGNPTDIYNVFEQQGVQILRGQKGAQQVAESQSKRILLLNPEDYGNNNELGYAIKGADADTVGLSLLTSVDACLAHLEKNSPKHFFMMIEEGMIDHSLHGNDGGTAIRQVLSFDRVIARVLEFYRAHPDETLIVITADHDTGGMSNGCAATGYNAFYRNVDAQTMSKDRFSDLCQSMLRDRRVYTWDDMKELLARSFGLGTTFKLKKEQEEDLEEAFKETFVDRNSTDEKGLYKTSNAFAAEVFKVFNDASGFGFTTRNHTGNFPPVFAIGVGSDRFAGTLNNIDIPQIIRSLTLKK